MKAAFFRHLPRKGWISLALVMLAASLTIGTATASSASTSSQNGHYGAEVRPDRGHGGVPATGHREADVQPDLPLVRAVGEGIDSSSATPQATCNYRVWWGAGINIHTQKDRESRIVYHLDQDTVLYGQTCNNSTGGNYGSCQPSNLWKAVTYGTAAGWVATKCLQRV